MYRCRHCVTWWDCPGSCRGKSVSTTSGEWDRDCGVGKGQFVAVWVPLQAAAWAQTLVSKTRTSRCPHMSAALLYRRVMSVDKSTTGGMKTGRGWIPLPRLSPGWRWTYSVRSTSWAAELSTGAMRKGRVWRGDVSTRMPVLNMDMLLADVAETCSCRGTTLLRGTESWNTCQKAGKAVTF